MRPNQWRKPENSRREEEMSRAECIVSEMASGVRLLGSDGRNAAEQNHLASRLSGLPVSVVERLRWRKLRRVPADVADSVRDALNAYNARAEAKAQHDREVIAARIASLDAYARHSSDPDFLRTQAAGLVEQARRIGIPVGPVAPRDDEGGE